MNHRRWAPRAPERTPLSRSMVLPFLPQRAPSTMPGKCHAPEQLERVHGEHHAPHAGKRSHNHRQRAYTQRILTTGRMPTTTLPSRYQHRWQMPLCWNPPVSGSTVKKADYAYSERQASQCIMTSPVGTNAVSTRLRSAGDISARAANEVVAIDGSSVPLSPFLSLPATRKTARSAHSGNSAIARNATRRARFSQP